MISVTELSKLHRLAEHEDVPAAQVVRRLIRSEYQKRFGDEQPTTTSPTLRGILTDMTGRAHLTAGDIAERAALPIDAVDRALRRAAKKGVVELEDGSGANATWRSLAKPDRDRDAVFALAEAKGLDLDDPLVEREGA
jgi:hypothetical protein